MKKLFPRFLLFRRLRNTVCLQLSLCRLYIPTQTRFRSQYNIAAFFFCFQQAYDAPYAGNSMYSGQLPQSPLRNVSTWRGSFEPSTATFLAERERGLVEAARCTCVPCHNSHYNRMFPLTFSKKIVKHVERISQLDYNRDKLDKWEGRIT